MVGLGSLAPYLVWYLALYLGLGATSKQVAQSSPLWLPFSGVRYLADPVSLGLVGLWVLGPSLLSGVYALWGVTAWYLGRIRSGEHWEIRRKQGAGGLGGEAGASKDSWLAGGGEYSKDAFLVLAQVGLVSLMPALTWGDPLAVLRVGLGLLAAVLVWLASSHPRVLPFAAALWLPSGAVLFLVPGMM
jgi:hypothetical protein